MAAQKKLGSITKDYRTKHKLSVRDFAKRSGVSKSYISKLEKNEPSESGKEIVPSLDIMVGIAKAMEMDTTSLLKKIGMDIEAKEDAYDATNPAAVPVRPMSKIKPFTYIPLTQPNLVSAIKERRVLILPFPAPREGDLVYLPVQKLGMAVAHTVTKVDGGVYEAHAESNGTVAFSLFDIGVSVFLTRGEAAERIKNKPQDF